MIYKQRPRFMSGHLPFGPHHYDWWLALISYVVWGQLTSDIYDYWHRAHYGWAEKDVWSLDCYLDQVMSGTLDELAASGRGYPSCYPGYEVAVDTDVNKLWKEDLRRWAGIFAMSADRFGDGATVGGEQQINEARELALTEMLPWWPNLWW